MNAAVLDTATTPDTAAVHVALSSFELSALRFIDFDPDVAHAVRQGACINAIDGDDSGALCYIVPLPGFPEAVDFH